VQLIRFNPFYIPYYWLTKSWITITGPNKIHVVLYAVFTQQLFWGNGKYKLMSIFSVFSKNPMDSGALWNTPHMLPFCGEKSQSWWATPCQLSDTAFSRQLQLPSLSATWWWHHAGMTAKQVACLATECRTKLHHSELTSRSDMWQSPIFGKNNNKS